jgi:hypothetical protein
VHLKKSSNLVNLEFTFLPNFLYCSLWFLCIISNNNFARCTLFLPHFDLWLNVHFRFVVSHFLYPVPQ